MKRLQGERYYPFGMLPKTVSPERVPIHDHVVHGRFWGCGINGFRCWMANKPLPAFVPCPCGYAGLKHYARKEHLSAYRKSHP
jgi:hypothetical protein